MSMSPDVLLRPLELNDLIQIKPILERWVRNSLTGVIIPEEVEGVLESMRQSIAGDEKRYIVAQRDQLILGEVGLATPDKKMDRFCLPSTRTAELINFYVHPDHRGQGVGTRLFDHLSELAGELGYGALIWNSGPRYRATAWDFYDRLPGVERAGEARHMYGVGAHAPVWRKIL